MRFKRFTNALDAFHVYMLKAMEHLESFILECDRKTELAKRRLKETQEELSEEAAGKVRRTSILHEILIWYQRSAWFCFLTSDLRMGVFSELDTWLIRFVDTRLS